MPRTEMAVETFVRALSGSDETPRSIASRDPDLLVEGFALPTDQPVGQARPR